MVNQAPECSRVSIWVARKGLKVEPAYNPAMLWKFPKVYRIEVASSVCQSTESLVCQYFGMVGEMQNRAKVCDISIDNWIFKLQMLLSKHIKNLIIQTPTSKTMKMCAMASKELMTLDFEAI